MSGGAATPGYFDVAGARPALGRLFAAADLERSGPVAVVLAHDTWRRQFAADPGVVGRAVTMDGRDAVVVGVLAEDAYTPLVEAEAWVPLTAIADDVTNRGWRGFGAIGRLAPGATIEGARQEMELVRKALAASYPEANRDYGLEVHGLREKTAAPLRGTLVAFLAAVSCLLLIGCANVASLMIVRATGRSRELALRAALGAARGRLVRETLAESLVLAAVGAALGLLVSWMAVRAFVVLAPARLPRVAEVTLDARALVFGTVVSLATVLVFGLAPALRAARVDLVSILQGARTTDGGGARVRRGLVVAQVALALALRSRPPREPARPGGRAPRRMSRPGPSGTPSQEWDSAVRKRTARSGSSLAAGAGNSLDAHEFEPVASRGTGLVVEGRMDIARPDIAEKKKKRRRILIAGGAAAVLLVSLGLSRLRPAAPTVDSTVWIDEVKRGPMVRQVHGLGTLVPVEIRWIAAQTERPGGAHRRPAGHAREGRHGAPRAVEPRGRARRARRGLAASRRPRRSSPSCACASRASA